jgi:hypothetical protein
MGHGGLLITRLAHLCTGRNRRSSGTRLWVTLPSSNPLHDDRTSRPVHRSGAPAAARLNLAAILPLQEGLREILNSRHSSGQHSPVRSGATETQKVHQEASGGTRQAE